MGVSLETVLRDPLVLAHIDLQGTTNEHNVAVSFNAVRWLILTPDAEQPNCFDILKRVIENTLLNRYKLTAHDT